MVTDILGPCPWSVSCSEARTGGSSSTNRVSRLTERAAEFFRWPGLHERARRLRGEDVRSSTPARSRRAYRASSAADANQIF